jgi:hypothetical protein
MLLQAHAASKTDLRLFADDFPLEMILDAAYVRPEQREERLILIKQQGLGALQSAQPFGAKTNVIRMSERKRLSHLLPPSLADYGHPVPVPVKAPEFETRAPTVGAGTSRAALFAFASFWFMRKLATAAVFVVLPA